VSYTRGTDLSGSLEGAGGIGGLLARSHGDSGGNWSIHNFYHADGNGNITYLVDSSQALAASYRYDPFGNTISSSGSLADANVYRFSSKMIHANSGLYYYGYRWYAPDVQRWLNRDPIGEWGSINLSSFVGNSSVNEIDALGLRGMRFNKLDCDALRRLVSKYFYLATQEPWNKDAWERKADDIQGLIDRFCDDEDDGDPHFKSPLVFPWRTPVIRPFNPFENNRCPVNSVAYPPSANNEDLLRGVFAATLFLIIVVAPWPGNPIYGGG